VATRTTLRSSRTLEALPNTLCVFLGDVGLENQPTHTRRMPNVARPRGIPMRVACFLPGSKSQLSRCSTRHPRNLPGRVDNSSRAAGATVRQAIFKSPARASGAAQRKLADSPPQHEMLTWDTCPASSGTRPAPITRRESRYGKYWPFTATPRTKIGRLPLLGNENLRRR